MLDAATLAHLDRWLDHVARDEERDELRAAIVALAEAEPDLLDRGWPALRDMVEASR